MSHTASEAPASYTEIIALARSRRAALVSERVLLDSEIRKLDELIGLAGGTADLGAADSDNARSRQLVIELKRDASPAEIVHAARKALEMAGRPLGRAALFKAVQDSGINVPGLNPIKNFGTILWRSTEIENGIEGYVLPGCDYAR